MLFIVMHIAPELYKKYPKEKIEEAVRQLTYVNVDPLPKDEPEQFPILYIFRHGQSEDNANFLFSGWRDSKITEEGVRQAEVLADKLKNKKIDMLVSSPQTRAVETMKIAISKNARAKLLEIHFDERVKERSYGDLQGKSKLEMQLTNPKLLHDIRRSYTKSAPNGESLETVCKRVSAFCDEIIPLMKDFNINVAISCHGNSIRGFRQYFEHLTPEEVQNIETPLGQDYAAYSIK